MLDLPALIAFDAVIAAGSFSAAAARLGQTPSGVSRTISRFEARLGMTLIVRTTRRLDLTEEGAWLLERARKVLAELAETEAQLPSRRAQPAGLVRVNAATPALDFLIAPLAAQFMDAYPLVRLELTSGETVIDLIEERADLAIRIGNLADSSLNARKLGTSALRLLAAPAYLARHGVPRSVDALVKEHRLLGFSAPASLNIWPLAGSGTGAGAAGLAIEPVLRASNGGSLRQLALHGAGIVCLSHFMTRHDLASGALVPVLDELRLPWTQPIWAVFYKQGALAPRVAALVDFLARRLAESGLDS
ncbi:LysR substrate-binding domain-containing protein [Massilia sp. DWR3-1-1]|uniref:LysR substrate-binding domain-containing protein n=1 Tax=Massilia sp. DWR3-1-1 TaxID=2804559 RepID=UPI003CF9C08D